MTLFIQCHHLSDVAIRFIKCGAVSHSTTIKFQPIELTTHCLAKNCFQPGNHTVLSQCSTGIVSVMSYCTTVPT